MEQFLKAETRVLVEELLDLMTNDSENLERTMNLLTDDCTWVIEPGVTEYHGSKEIRAFVSIAMSGRKHDEKHKIEVLNHFADNDNVCLEYTHSAVLTGKMTAGLKGTLKPGAARYCMTYHIRDGKFDRVHEYINSPSVWLSFISPVALKCLHWQTIRKLSKTAESKMVTKRRLKANTLDSLAFGKRYYHSLSSWTERIGSVVSGQSLIHDYSPSTSASMRRSAFLLRAATADL